MTKLLHEMERREKSMDLLPFVLPGAWELLLLLKIYKFNSSKERIGNEYFCHH